MSDGNLAGGKGPTAGRAPLPRWWWDLTLQGRRVIAIGVVVALFVVVVVGVQSIVSSQPNPDRFVARLSPARVDVWDSLAECESGGDWSANTGNGYYGGLQFGLDSWADVGGETRPDLASRNEQIMRAETLEDSQGFGAWPTCSAELGLP